MPTSSEANQPTADQDLEPAQDLDSGPKEGQEVNPDLEAEPDHSWPDTSAVTGTAEATGAAEAAKVIAAGEDLKIIATGQEADRATPSTRPDVVEPTAANPVLPRLVAWFRTLVVPPDDATIDGHRIEFNTPVVWLWRRLVGLCFCYITVSFLWYIVKLPSGLVSDETLPTQIQVAEGFHELRRDGVAGTTLAAHFNATVGRLVLGLAFGSATGLAVGLVGAVSPLVRTIVDPLLSMLRFTPAVAVGPLLILWFGTGRGGVIGAVAFAVAWTVATSVTRWRTGLHRPHGIDAERSGSERPISVLTDGARTALLTAWSSTLAIETIMADDGLGPMVWFAQGRADLVTAGLVVIGVTAGSIDIVLRMIEYLTVRNLAATEQR